MLTIPDSLLCSLADQSPTALGTIHLNLAIDRSLRWSAHFTACFRDGWISEDRSDDPILQAAFPYDREFSDSHQTILLHRHADYDFVLITIQLGGESEVECLILGYSYDLVTRDMFRAGWCSWSESDDAPLPISDIRQAVDKTEGKENV